MRHNIQRERTLEKEAITALTSTNSALSQTLVSEYGVSAKINEGKIAYSEGVENSKVYAKMLLTLFFLIAFEFSVAFKSKWDEEEYAHGVLTNKYDDPDYKAALLGKR